MFLRKIILIFFILCLFCNEANAIKIGLQTNTKNVKIASSVYADVYDGFRNSYIYEFKPMKVYEIRTKGRELAVYVDRKETLLNTNQLIIKTRTEIEK